MKQSALVPFPDSGPVSPVVRRVPAHLRVARVTRLYSREWERISLVLLLGLGVFVHADNMFNFPRYQLDEGTYIASAWAVLHGSIFVYTFNYGHPPLGWALIALGIKAIGGFFSFGTSIDSGRVVMLGIFVLSAVLVYGIARQLTTSHAAGLLAMALFSVSPLAVTYQREVLLDNVGTFWMLVSLFLLVRSGSQLRALAASAGALGIACLSKETMVVFLPALVYGVWVTASKFQRRFALVVFGYISVAIGSTFILLATLKGELFPTGTFLGGSKPHVSLLSTLASQAQRGAAQGSFTAQLAAWWGGDAPLMALGLVALLGNLLLLWRRPALRIVVFPTLLYWLFLARGGVTLGYYLLPIIPLQALSIALFVHTLERDFHPDETRLAAWLRKAPRLPSWRGPSVLACLFIVLVPIDLGLDRSALTVNAAQPEVQALQWVGLHVPRTAFIVANNYFWVDLHDSGGLATSYGAPFDRIQMYWEVATDPAIRVKLLHDNWNNIDYVFADSDMMVDMRNFHMTIIQQAIQHATLVASFQNRLTWVKIYQVEHPATPTILGASVQAPKPKLAAGSRSRPLVLPRKVSPPRPIVSPRMETPTARPMPAMPMVSVAVSALRLRGGPSFSAPIISTVRSGAVLPVLARAGIWIRTIYQGREVWIDGQWVRPQP